MQTRLLIRLVAPIAIVSACLLGVGLGAAWYVTSLQSSISRVLVQNVASLRAAEELEIGMLEIRAHLDRFLIKAEFPLLDKVPELRKNSESLLAEVTALATTEHEQAVVAEIQRGYDEFFREYDKYTKQKQPQELFTEISSLMDKLLFEEMLRPTRNYRQINEQMVVASTERNRERASTYRMGLLALGIGGSALGLLVGLVIAWGIRRAIVQIHVQLRDTTGILNEVAGPVVMHTGEDLRDVQNALDALTGPIGTLVGRLQQTRLEALRAEQLAMVGQLAAGIAHEVRNPLMAIKILVQAGAERYPDGNLRGRELGVLEEEISRLERLICSFLDFARPPQVEKRPVDASKVLEQTLDLLAAKAELHGVHLRTEKSSGSLLIEADLGQFHQLLFNLVLNAIEASLPGGTVTIHLDATVASLRVSVTDEGNGLPESLGDTIFEPFISGKQTGMGLGLSICRRVVETHRGTLVAVNRPEGGAEFTATLPMG